MRRVLPILVILGCLIGWHVPQAAAQQAEITSCSDCHAREQDAPRDVHPSAVLADSIHADLDCTDCHASIDMGDVDPSDPKPHGDSVEPVNCGDCHEEAAEEYEKHGRFQLGRDPDLPACWDCHGGHDVAAVDDTRSRVHPIHLPETCRSCHTDVDLVKKHDVLRDAPIRLYESSVHGRASKKGLYVSATCNDCHSSTNAEGKRTAHRILSAGDAESTIYHFNIPDTCGQCHPNITRDYWDGIHGRFVKQGQVDSPVCTHCHGEHGIIRANDPRSPVSPPRVAEATCAPCHESEVLNEKYGIPAGRLRSYVDSYHGLKSKAGDVRVANCASCHGAHRILPHTDPTSSIHPDNLRETCGECHPGISTELASTPIHETATGINTGWPAFFRVLYLWLIGVTIGLMVLHNAAEVIRHVKNMRKKPYVIRMTPNETFQHFLLAISFTVLVISGFSLRFSEAFWVRAIFGWGDGAGFVYRGHVHRIAAALFMICAVWHIISLFGQRGRRALRDMLPGIRDIIDVKNNALFFLGLRDERPRFGRFSYAEKAEYWALVWGGIVMTITGLLLWFDNYFVTKWHLPKGILDVMLVIHYYEAWLATLAIVVWHGYGVVYSPHVYPMNPAWINGAMPREMYVHEHPEGPKLKARVQRVFDEAEENEVDEHQSGATDPAPPRED